jgi:hypothetical protein
MRSVLGASLALAVCAALLVLAGSGGALACACCTNAGQRNVNVATLDSGRAAEIERLRFGGAAQLFVGEGGPESIDGITTPAESYTLTAAWQGDRLVFTFADAQGHTGTLSLLRPGKVSIFEVDPRDGADQGLGPVLYKEWKLTSKAAVTGVFASGMGPSQVITLIVQGRGNSCTSAEDFSHWTLVVEGPKANYSFFGELVPAP